jgi:hypothetical protein
MVATANDAGKETEAPLLGMSMYPGAAMDLPRAQLFEFNDASWAPAVLRDTLVEALSRALDWGHVLRELAAPFEAFVAASGAEEILDLAAGAGGPARILAGELLRAGRRPPRFVLTDLHPHRDAWEDARAAFPGVIDFEPEPVDATRIPERLGRGRARLIINALHHFPPAIARGVFEDAVRCGAPIFISECFERNPLGFASMTPAGAAALLATPILAQRDRLLKALLVWGTPVAFAASAWDGVVSTLRTWTRADLEAMVAPFGDAFEWRYGTFTFPIRGTGYYFHGMPRRA